MMNSLLKCDRKYQYMNRKEWNEKFAQRLVEQSDMPYNICIQFAEASDDSYDDGEGDPIDSADEEMTYWD